MTPPDLTPAERACLVDAAGGPLLLADRWATYAERLKLARLEGKPESAAAERRRLFCYTRAGAGEHFSPAIMGLAAKGLIQFDDNNLVELIPTAAGRRVLEGLAQAELVERKS